MIDCHQHDYIEIAALYKIPVTLQLKQGAEHKGIIQDWFINPQREECLILRVQDDFISLLLTDLLKMTADMPNPHFDEITFTS